MRNNIRRKKNHIYIANSTLYLYQALGYLLQCLFPTLYPYQALGYLLGLVVLQGELKGNGVFVGDLQPTLDLARLLHHAQDGQPRVLLQRLPPLHSHSLLLLLSLGSNLFIFTKKVVTKKCYILTPITLSSYSLSTTH